MTAATASLSGFDAPSLGLLGVEPMRAAFEYASMRFMDRRHLPTGDGHPVVIFPGLATDKHCTRPLKDFCDELGYEAHDWGRGFNTGPQGHVDDWLDELAAHVDTLTAGRHERASLIGWSLGGIYAREIAKRLPRRIRRVLTIGTPFAGGAEQTNVGWLYRLLNGSHAAFDDTLMQRLRTAPAVPTTSIYSRSDGIVAWQACLNADVPHTENVEVVGSHCGLAWNPAVLSIVADRLSRLPS